MLKHIFFSQTKHIGLAVSIFAKHPLLLLWVKLETTVYMKTTVSQISWHTKKLRYWSSSHKLAPWENQCWQPKLNSCLSAWVTHPAPPAIHPCPSPALTPTGVPGLGEHLPSWGFKINQNGGKEMQSWQLCLGGLKESSPPHLSGQITSHVSILTAPGRDCATYPPRLLSGKPS